MASFTQATLCNTATATWQADVTAFQDECARDLAVAEPVIREAEAALNSLDKASLGELKSFGSPAADVVMVVSSCIALTAPGGKIPKARVANYSCLKHAGCCDSDLETCCDSQFRITTPFWEHWACIVFGNIWHVLHDNYIMQHMLLWTGRQSSRD